MKGRVLLFIALAVVAGSCSDPVGMTPEEYGFTGSSPIKEIRAVELAGAKLAIEATQPFAFLPDTVRWILVDTTQLYRYVSSVRLVPAATADFEPGDSILYWEERGGREGCCNVVAAALLPGH